MCFFDVCGVFGSEKEVFEVFLCGVFVGIVFGLLFVYGMGRKIVFLSYR